MLSKLSVNVSVALATEVNPVPPAISTVSPSVIVCVPESPVNVHELIVPGEDPEDAAVNLPCASTVNEP